MQQNYKVPLQLGSGRCPASVPCWMKSGFAVNILSKLCHQALALGKIKVSLEPFKRKCISYGNDAAFFNKKVLFLKNYAA